VNDVCVRLGKVDVFAGIQRFEGHASVFNLPDANGDRGPNYRDLFPVPPPAGSVPDCAEAGVLGVLPGIMGSIKALEVIKVITGVGEPLSGRLFLLDGASFQTRTVTIKPRSMAQVVPDDGTGSACMANGRGTDAVRHVSPVDLKRWMDDGVKVSLIDVREPYESELASIGGELIPLRDVLEHAPRMARDERIVFYCRSGGRSAEAIRRLQDVHGLENLFNLHGGILAWSKDVDPGVPLY
jgi:sulfur-carrier protein adenylyltransferase/sulfurtransferase